MNETERKKIILVDDNMASLTIGRDILKAHYEVYPAPSAVKMFEILEKILPQMILLDVDMPDINGFEAIKKLKADTRLSNIQVIFLTAMSDEASELKGLELGALDYIYKPFSAPLLLKRIETHLAKLHSDEANKIKSSFLAGMSHEIRTPMNAIIGMTELLQHEPLNNQQMGFVNDINSSAQTLLTILSDLIDLSKIEIGKFVLTPVDYNFRTFIGSVVTTVTYLAEKRGINFIFKEGGELPNHLFGDHIRLKQILLTLCQNAVKFTDSGFVRLSVFGEKNKISFEIQDTGRGINKIDLPKIFDVYAQLKNRAIVGTGLGLSITKSFVELMDGTISVESEDGAGTTFKISIPIVGGEEKISHDEDKHKKLFAPNANVLVVDDNDFNLKVACGLLGIYKIAAKTVMSGQAAIDSVQREDFDIVFMDHMMPHMDGVVATEKIRKLGGKFRLLPIVALTATTIEGAREMFLSHGFNGYLPKPINVKEMRNILIEWLPPDKITDEMPVPEKPKEKPESILSDIAKISEINTEIGLNRFAGNEKLYKETIEDFHKNFKPKCEKLQDQLEANDISNFAISIHFMKTSLATIGAMR
ncbi:MAG: response regulator, partial [Clostridiales bacterium]|nr:response regulator [Clostridiales bacterium]